MRKTFAIILFFFVATISYAQKYCNEWINYNQQYVKFPVSKEGIYRIDSAVLSNHYNLSTVNPKNFQLFFKGKEQFVFIQGEADNALNTGDYLEFYLDPRAREVDSLIYTGIRYVPNPYVSLFNDTIYAFLTLNNSLSNKRYQVESDVNFGNYNAPSYFYTEKIKAFSGQYNFVQEYSGGDVSDPLYTQAEGKGEIFGKGDNRGSAFTNLNPYTALPLPAFFSVQFAGASVSNAVSIDHQVTVSFQDVNTANVQLFDTSFRAYVPLRKNFNINAQDIGNNSNFMLSSVAAPQLSAINNAVMVHSMAFYYPHSLNFNNESFYKLIVDDNANTTKSHFNFSGFNSGGAVLLYDITNGKKIPVQITGNQAQAVIPNGQGKKTCIMAAAAAVIQVTNLKKINQTGSFSNFKNGSGPLPYLIIYHKSLEGGAMAYKNYRQSPAGGSYQVIAANVDELYEQFAQGINKHPLAIRNFVKYLNDSLGKPPKYVLLVGKSIEQDELENSSQYLNLVPTMGFPASDVLLTASLTQPLNTNYFPDIPIGRIAAYTNSQVNAYLDKVQQHESSGVQDWKKRVLHFVGGDSPELSSSLEAYMNGYRETIMDTLFGGRSAHL